MKIGLIDVDGHAKKKKWGATIYPNLALCKIARYHKQQGDDVEWALPFEHYDVLYMSKVFNFSPDDKTVYQADRVVRGGDRLQYYKPASRRDRSFTARLLYLSKHTQRYCIRVSHSRMS